MYEFAYKTGAADLWQMSMYYTYTNLVGKINIIFTVAMVFLTVGTWNSNGIALRILLILASCWFVVFQPMIMWGKAKKRAKLIQTTTELHFSDAGMKILVEDQTETIPWTKIFKVVKLPTMVIIYSDAVHGYVLNNHTLGTKKKEFIHYLSLKASDKHK